MHGMDPSVDEPVAEAGRDRHSERPADGPHERNRLKAAQIRFLCGTGQVGALMTLVIVPVMGVLLYGHVDRDHLMLWGAVVTVVTLWRLIFLRRVSRGPLTAHGVDRVRHTYLLVSLLSGAAWGSAAFLVFPDNPPQQLFLAFVLGGIGAGAVAVHSVWFSAVMLFTLPATLPMVARLYLEGTDVHTAMAAISLLFLAIVFFIAARTQGMANRALELAMENSDLVGALRGAKRDADELNAGLALEVEERRKAEHRLRVERDFIAGVLDTECAIVMVLDRQWRIARFNRACEAATGFSAHELVGESLWERLVPSEDVPRLRASLDAVLSRQAPTECEVRWRTRDGGHRLIHLSNTVVLDTGGEPTHVVSTGIDVTQRRAAEAELERSREDFRLLVEGVTNYAIYMLDPQGRVTSWNQGAERITGYSAEEIIGRHYSILHQDAEASHGNPALPLRLASVYHRHEYEGWSVRKDGSRFWAVMTLTPLSDGDGGLRGYSVITGDLTQRKQTEDTIRGLLTVSEALTATLDIDHIMNALVRRSLALLDADAAWAALVEDGELTTTRYYRHGLGASTAPQLSTTDGLAAEAVRTRRPVRTADAAADRRITDALRRRFDLRSVLCCPILDYEGRVAGVIEVHNKHGADGFDESDERKLVSVSQTAALAVQNATAYQRLKRAESLLAAETSVLESVARDAGVNLALHEVARTIERYWEGTIAALITLNPKDASVAECVAPSLGADPLLTPGAALPAGTMRKTAAEPRAEATGQDISDDADWDALLRETSAAGMPGRWLWPVHTTAGQVTGLLLVLRPQRRAPASQEADLMAKAVHLAGIALERRHAESALRLRERAIESSINAILVLNVESTRHEVVYANPATGRITGYSPESLMDRPWHVLFSDDEPEARKRVHELQEALHQRRTAHRVLQGRRADGTPFWVETYLSPVNEPERSGHFVAVMHDISDRVRTEQALRESKAQYEAITQNIPDMVCQFTRRAGERPRFLYASAGAQAVCGLEASQIMDDAEALLALIPESDRETFTASLDSSTEALCTWTWEGRIRTPDGELRWISARATPRRLDHEVTLWDGIIFNITDRKQAEIELKQTGHQLRALSTHLQTVREDEKASLARELHDELGATLTALKIDIAWLRRRMDSDHGPDTEKIGAMLGLVDSAISTTRRISSELRPPILDDMGLIAAVEWQLREFEKRMGIICELDTAGDPTRLDPTQSIALFRIFQEALTNISRHAEASRVSAMVHIEHHQVMLEIIDNGRGMDHDSDATSNSHGLHGMYERAHALGGTLVVDSSPGNGTRLKAIIPLGDAIEFAKERVAR